MFCQSYPATQLQSTIDSLKRYLIDNIAVSFIPKDSLENLLQSSIKNSVENNIIVTFNLDFLRNTNLNSNFKQICKNAFLVLPDGIGITSLIYLKHGKMPPRITGSDVFSILLSIAEKNKLPIALVGSSIEVQKLVTQKIKSAYPNLIVAAALSPPKYFETKEIENERVVLELQSAKPDILFVALGSPRQEIWIEQNKNIIGAKINVGVGAVFDFYSGKKKRAPKIFQKLGLEWFWRLLNEPKRLFTRYILNDLPFYFKMIIQIVKEK